MVTISFVVPVYNEEERLGRTFRALEDFSAPKGLKLESVIFVDDGSSDSSAKLIGKFAKSFVQAGVTVLSLSQNLGKGAAVRAGMKAVESDYGLFFDSDISTPLSEVEKFLSAMENGIDVIVGTRKNGKSTVLKHQPFYREYLGRIFTKASQFVFQLSVSDMTCGFKAYSKKAINLVFYRSCINGWAFDVEVLMLAKNFNLLIVERAVIWSDGKGSKVRLWVAIPQVLADVCKIMISHKLNLNTRLIMLAPSKWLLKFKT